MQNGNIITWHSASLKGNKNSFLSSCITVYLFLLRHESFKFLFFGLVAGGAVGAGVSPGSKASE